MTLWEIFSLGAHPYSDRGTSEILGLLKSGFRLPRPEGCPDPVYSLMLRCWSLNPQERPQFTDIVPALQTYLPLVSNTQDAFSDETSVEDTYRRPAPPITTSC